MLMGGTIIIVKTTVLAKDIYSFNKVQPKILISFKETLKKKKNHYPPKTQIIETFLSKRRNVREIPIPDPVLGN